MATHRAGSRTPSGVRPEIQALRAGAAMLVVVYHLWPGFLPGGFMGVDVFFVISGFLITSHLAKEADGTGRIRLARFWARRARRLLPAAYLVLLTSAVAVYVWVPQIHWVQNFREILAAGLYAQNWRLAFDAVDYLAAENSPSVAQHYWTLSVEEQFYVAWPLLVLLAIAIAARLKAQRLGSVAVVVGLATAASFAYSLWLTYANGSFAYFSTFTRAWEFGAGALLALATLALARRERPDRLDPRLAATLSWAGLAGLAWCGFRFSGDTAFPGTAALLPVLATVAVIAAGMPATRVSPGPLLALRPVQWVGDVSYPVYLWHWPPIVVVPYVLGHDMGFLPRLAILLGTFVAAALTKRFVEDPVRHGRRLGIQRSTVTFAFTVAAAAVLASTTLTGIHRAEAASREAVSTAKDYLAHPPRCFGAASMAPGKPCDNPELDGLLVPDTTAVAHDAANYPNCKSLADSSVNERCTFGDAKDPDLPHVVVIGDSHGRALLPAFRRMAEEGRIYLTGLVKGGCNWSDNPDPTSSRKVAEACYTWRDNASRWLADHADDTDVVVTTALAHPDQAGTPAERAAGFAKLWKPLVARGTPLVVIRDNPYHDKDTNDCLATKSTITPKTCATPRDKAFPTFDALTPAAELVPQAHLYDLTSFYCTSTECPSVIGGVNVYRDKHHVSGTYMKTLEPFIRSRLEADGLLKRRAG